MANNIWVNITDLLWPVGSVYTCWDTSNDPTDLTTKSPANYFGGSWIGPISDGSITNTNNNTIYYLYKYLRSG